MPFGVFYGVIRSAKADMTPYRKNRVQKPKQNNNHGRLDRPERTVLMQSLFNIINIPFGYIMRMLSTLFGGNFAAAVFAFTLLINVILIPLNIKSQKSTVQQTRIKPKLDELKKRYGDDRQKYSEAMQKLYQDEGVSMSGGCLPMLIRLLLMLSIYSIILSPLTYMANADSKQVANVTNAISTAMNDLKQSDNEKYTEISNKISWKSSSRGSELSLIKIIHDDPGILEDLLPEKEYAAIESDLAAVVKADRDTNVSYAFLGIDLTETPKFSFDIFHDAQRIWIMPIIAFLAQMFTSALSLITQKKINPDAQNMAGMMLTMPLISLVLGFTFPGGVTFYWACSALISGLIQVGVQNFYGPYKMLSRQRMKELVRECDFETNQLKKAEQEPQNDSAIE